MLVIGLAVAAGGCSQTTNQITTTEAAITGPLVLNSAPGANPEAAAAPLAPAAVAPAAAGPAPVPTNAPAPVATAAPPPAQPVQPTALQSEPMPTTAAATATAEEGSFPNINKPPGQPGGTLLPEATRAQIIADLEKLRAGQQSAGGGGGGGKPSDLAGQAQTHGAAAIQQIEECSADGALQNNPACAPAD